MAIAFAKYFGGPPGCGENNVLATIPLGSLLPIAIYEHFPGGLEHLEINSAQVVACG